MVRAWLVPSIGAALVLSGCSLLPGNRSDAPVAAAEQIPPVPALVVLDASGSMKADDAPGVRFAAAQAAVVSLVDVLPDGHDIGLDVYGTSTGSKDSEEVEGCQDIKTVVPFGKLDKASFTAKVGGLKASGYTPIAAALTKAAGELPAKGRRAVVLVSDGIDTCAEAQLGNDPCKVAKNLHGADPDLVIHTVGFKVQGDRKAREQLTCIAKSTGGLDLDASNGQLLRTRLAAAFNPGLAARSIQPSGYRGLDLGMDLAQARRIATKLGEVKSSGRVVIRYVDCDLVFEDGILTEIRSANKEARTLDGLTVGADVAQAERIYGTPGTPSVPVKNSITYVADETAGTGYKILFEPSRAKELTGKIITITLCKCAPSSGTKIIVLHPFTASGAVDPQYQVDRTGYNSLLSGEFAEITATPSPSYFSEVRGTYSVGGTADNAGACWAAPDGDISVLCASGPWSKTLRALAVTELPDVAPVDEPGPYGLELADGSRWEARIGGSWGGRADGWNGAFYCVDRCTSDSLYVLYGEEHTLDREDGRWYAYVGELGEPDEAFPAPQRQLVKEVRFIG